MELQRAGLAQRLDAVSTDALHEVVLNQSVDVVAYRSDATDAAVADHVAPQDVVCGGLLRALRCTVRRLVPTLIPPAFAHATVVLMI